MAVCVLDEQGYCGRHRKVHRGRELYWALSDTEKGEKYRRLWDETPRRSPSPPGRGPGTELKALLASLGVTPAEGCGCELKVSLMDGWGVEGCTEQRATIIDWLRQAQAKSGWNFGAAARAVASGLAFKVNPLDPIPGLVDLAIEHARAKGG